MRKAALLGGEVLSGVLKLLKPGVREIEVAAEIEYQMRRRGASGPAFESIVAFGARSAYPHARPTKKCLGKNELVVLDLGVILGHYCSDITRTVFVGRAPARIRRWYSAVQEAQAAAVAAARAGITNIGFVTGDVYALPFADGVAGVVACGYAFHHMVEPARALAEMARVLRPGGRVAIADIIVPEGPGGAIQNAIERARDPSHTNAQSVAQFHTLIRDAGLRLLSEESRQHWYDFNLWMRNAGIAPGDADYLQVRRMMEEIMDRDVSGLQPRHSEKTGGLEFLHTTLLLVAEKPE